MKDNTDDVVEVMPSAIPSEDDIRRWEALSRDEQLRRLRAALMHPDCGVAVPDSMRNVLAEARTRLGKL